MRARVGRSPTIPRVANSFTRRCAACSCSGFSHFMFLLWIPFNGKRSSMFGTSTMSTPSSKALMTYKGAFIDFQKSIHLPSRSGKGVSAKGESRSRSVPEVEEVSWLPGHWWAILVRRRLQSQRHPCLPGGVRSFGNLGSVMYGSQRGKTGASKSRLVNILFLFVCGGFPS